MSVFYINCIFLFFYRLIYFSIFAFKTLSVPFYIFESLIPFISNKSIKYLIFSNCSFTITNILPFFSFILIIYNIYLLNKFISFYKCSLFYLFILIFYSFFSFISMLFTSPKDYSLFTTFNILGIG
jgi:hypothetical protein